MQSGTKWEISPPKPAICLTTLELKNMLSELVGRNMVSKRGFSFLFASACWNSYSKSDTARRPFTTTMAPFSMA